MIQSLMQSYLIILLVISGSILLLLVIASCWIFRRDEKKESQQQDSVVFADADNLQPQRGAKLVATDQTVFNVEVDAIAGDDVIATQLDLARAYIETGKKQMAQALLRVVIERGSASQRQEAEALQRQ